MIQTHEHHWVFGDGVHIEFPSGGAPSLAAPTVLSSMEACSSVCDPNTGALLFYTDGETVWDSANSVVASNIGGNTSSFQGAIIVPPAGGGLHYHIFATYAVEQDTGPKDLIHSSYLVSGSTVTQIIAPTPMLGVHVSEHLAALSKPDCSGYWVVTREVNSTNLHLVSVDGDIPTVLGAQSLPISPGSIGEVGQMKFSPDGKYLAWADVYSHEVNIADFDSNTGTITVRNVINNVIHPMGLEFSPDSQLLYYIEQSNSDVFQHDITSVPPSSTPIDNATYTPVISGTVGSNEYHSMQIGPDGKIYIVGMNRNTMSVINSPNVIGSGLGFVHDAVDGTNSVITFPALSHFATPNFTRIIHDCSNDGCEAIANEVDEIIKSKFSELKTPLPYCEDKDFPNWCEDADLPDFVPIISIIWRRSGCDDIEGNDVEPLLLTVSNPYKNVKFCNVKIHKLTVLDASGNPVPLLPDGSPSVELIPIGPYCFGDIEGCEFTTREFVIRTRGAIPGDYEIKVEGVCFDICLHQNMSECFKLSICAD